MNRTWQVPEADSTVSYRLGYLNEIAADGQRWNESQPGFTDWKRSIEVLNGQEDYLRASEFRTFASSRRLRTNIRTAIAGLSNIRPIWGFQAADKAFAKIAMMYNKTSRALYLEGGWADDIKDWIAYAMGMDTGWIRPVFRRGMAGMGKGKIQLLTYGQPCVLPFIMPASGDYQEAYAVTLLDEWGVNEAHSRFPLYQDLLTPTKSQIWYASAIRDAAKKNADKNRSWNWWAKGDSSQSVGTDHYIPIRFTTIIDPSVNMTGKTVWMGQEGTPMWYKVPAYGEEIGLGYENPATGHEATRKATEDDARLYPFRRLMISSEKCIPYDGPAFNWHGQLDLIPLTVDRWPWAPGGFSMVHDGYNIQKNIDRLERGALSRGMAQNNLALKYDTNAVNPQEAQAFDPADPDNNRIGYDSNETQNPLEVAIPMEWYAIREEIFKFLERLDGELDYTMQMRDFVELSKSKILGKDASDLEKSLLALGPIVKGISSGMENALSMVGDQVGWLIPQYMTSSQVMSYVGAESMAMETFDYQPNDLYPSHLPDEIVHDAATQEQQPSRYSKAERARFARGKVKFTILPGSVHELHQMASLLIRLQMQARGFEISQASCMIAANIPDVKLPEGNSEQERYWTEREDKVTREARLAVFTQLTGTEQHIMPPPGTPAPTRKGGRPPSGGAPPELRQKANGRPTITESR